MDHIKEQVLEILKAEKECNETLISLIEKGLIEPSVDTEGYVTGYKVTQTGIEVANQLGIDPEAFVAVNDLDFFVH